MDLGIFVSFLLCTLAFASPDVRKNETYVEEEAYRFLGHTRHFSKHWDRECDSRYYLSQYPASWEDSREDCENNFGKGASLVAIETEHEFSKVTDFLLDSGTAASRFWVNGRQGRGGTVQWEFFDDKTEFDTTFLKWDIGEPILDSGRLNRLQLVVKSEIVFRMMLNTEAAYAICEIQKCD